MADLETTQTASEVQGASPEEILARAAAIPHPRRLPKIFNPVQGFNSAEHRQLGDGVANFGIEGVYTPALGYEQPLELAPDLKLTYGQIVALAGDLYGIADKPISSGKDGNDRRARFEAAFNSLVNCDRKELAKILEIMANEEKEVENGILDGKSADQAYTSGSDFDNQYMVATGYSWPTMGRYFDLAVKNFDHFGKDAVTAYTTGHARAIEEAVAAYDDWKNAGRGRVEAANRRFERALAMNAFADHFLTDLFASGHLRVPRREVAADFMEGHAAAVARHQHIEDNHFGLFVRNAKGRCWKCFGDGHLGTVQGYENRQAASAAIQLSYNEVFLAYNGRNVAKRFEALDNAPDIELVMQKEAGKTATTALNFSPAFIVSDGKTEGRYPFPESDTHAWSRLHYRNYAYDDRTSAALLFNNVFTGKSIEAIKPPYNMMPVPTEKPVLLRWQGASRSASPAGNGTEVRWAVAYTEEKAYPNGQGSATNVSALGPWSDYVKTRANEAPVLSIPVDPSGRATGRKIARQVKGMQPQFWGMGQSGNVVTEYCDIGV